MNVLITGAQFDNKGAQSLLFSVINEIKNRYHDVCIYYVPLDDITQYNCEQYAFEFVMDNQGNFDCEDIPHIIYRNLIFAKKVMKIIRKITTGRIHLLSKIWNKIDVVVDVSGYNLSSKWSMEINNRFLRYIKYATKKRIPVVLMPQSFGPFEYKNNQSEIDRRIKEVLSKVDVICAREEEGYNLLRNKYELYDNVFLYPDLVLDSQQIDLENIFSNNYTAENSEISTKENVGIVPNEQLFENGNEHDILNIYKEIIKYLVKNNNNVYIFRHSNDLRMCKKIYEISKCDKVHLVDKDFDCIEYGLFVKNFKYIVASRFHSIVHAYKGCVPAVILGWSTKYNNLAKLFDQDRYVADIQNADVFSIVSMIDDMENNLQENRNKIFLNGNNKNKETCYTKLWKVMDGIKE